MRLSSIEAHKPTQLTQEKEQMETQREKHSKPESELVEQPTKVQPTAVRKLAGDFTGELPYIMP